MSAQYEILPPGGFEALVTKIFQKIKDLLTQDKSYVGMIITSTTLDTEDKVKAQYGGTTWIQHSGYVLRGASSGVTANSAAKTAGNDSVSYTPTGSNTGMGIVMNSHTLTHSGGKVTDTKLEVKHLPSHTHGFTAGQVFWQQNDGYGQVIVGGTTGANRANIAKPSGTTGSTGSNTAHGHGFTQPNSHTLTPSVKTYTNPTFKGTAATINTLPQYKSVYIWERTV